MNLFFADDSRQMSPTRPGMGPLLAIGGIVLPKDNVKLVEIGIKQACVDFDFPPREKFKWSPGRELWMHSNLREEQREAFFKKIISLIESNGGKAIVIIEDTQCAFATSAASPESDLTNLFLERVQLYLSRTNTKGVVVVDRPSGGRPEEERFLLGCLETLQEGTEYLTPDRILLNVLSSPSRFVYLLQAADIVVGCTLATVAGEKRFAPLIFEPIHRIFDRESGRIGGVGLKIHPYFKYVNLYHWLLGDTTYVRWTAGHDLPVPERPYSTSGDIY